jgi:hypothetical protein
MAMRRWRKERICPAPWDISSAPIFRVGMETPRTDGRPLAPLHDTRQVGIQDGISLVVAFYQLSLHTPGATSGACHGTDSSLIWLTFRATSWENWGTWLWPDSSRSNFNLLVDGFCQIWGNVNTQCSLGGRIFFGSPSR